MSDRRQLTPPCLAAAISALLASACAPVGPEFTRPQVPWLTDWDGGSLQGVATPHAGGGTTTPHEWWLQFNDPVLSQIVAEALRLNPGVRTAKMRASDTFR